MKYDILQNRIRSLQSKIDEIQHRDRYVYRTLFSVDTLVIEGVNNPYHHSKYASLQGDEYSELMTSAWLSLDALTRDIYASSLALDELQIMAKNKEGMASAVPAIWPIDRTKLKAFYAFGLRKKHPIYKTRRMHKGVDMSTDYGVPVYATGDGVVEKIDMGRRRRGYGRQIVINHDFGYKTRYAHLRKMFVAMAKDIRVILIKVSDRLHNMRTMEYMSPKKQKEKSLETMEIYAPIAHRLGMQRMKWELEDLSLKYLDPVGYQEIIDAQEAVCENSDEARMFFSKMRRLFVDIRDKKLDNTDISILSIGNLNSSIKESVDTKSKKSGLLKWKANIISLPMKVNSIGTDYIIKILHRSNSSYLSKYERIECGSLTNDCSTLKLDSADEHSLAKLMELSHQDYNNKKVALTDFFKEEN